MQQVPSPPDNTPAETPATWPTPQLAHHTTPFSEEEEEEVFSSVDYEESNKENKAPIPPPGFIHNNAQHPFFYPIYLPTRPNRATSLAPFICYSPDYTLVAGSSGIGSETHTMPIYLTKNAGHSFNMTSNKWANIARGSPKEFVINMALDEINDPYLKGEVNHFRGKQEIANTL